MSKLLLVICLSLISSTLTNDYSLNFLQDVDPTAQQYSELFTNLLKGLDIFSDIPNFGECALKDIKENNLMNKLHLKNLKDVINSPLLANDLFSLFSLDIEVPNYKDPSKNCVEFSQKAKARLDDAKMWVITEVIDIEEHIRNQVKEILRIFTSANDQVKSGKFGIAGQFYGNALKKSLLSEYKPNSL